MVLVDGLDERRDILDPVRDRGCGASAGGCPGSVSSVTRKLRGQKRDVPRAALAPGLVGELPGKDGGLVDVARDEGLHVVLVRSLQSLVGIVKP